jgi:DNA-binding NarL/FixJ family response regulator
MIRIMLVDDRQYARLGYRLMLAGPEGKSTGLHEREHFDVVAEAGNGREAIETIETLESDQLPLPRVILMDVRMPVMDGITATREITRRWPAVKVLILTTYDEDDYAFGGLDAGASGFLLKDATAQALREAIQAVAGGDAVLTPRITREVLRRGVPHPAGDSRSHELRAMFDALTPRQREICSLVAEGLSNHEIATRLVVETASIRRAISRILAALDLHDRTQIAVAWYRAGK